MHHRTRKLALFSLAGMLALEPVAFVWAIGVGSSTTYSPGISSTSSAPSAGNLSSVLQPRP